MYQNYFKKCDGISLHTDDSKEFEYAQSQNKGVTFHHLNKNKEDVVFSHEDTKKLLKLPFIVLDESNDEELRINGESVCCHKRLYPVDVLKALAKHGIINFVYEK